MSGPNITVTERGAAKAAVDLAQLARRAADVRPAAEKAHDVFRRSEERTFQTRGDGSWPPLKASTRAIKARHGQNPAILRATDTLYRSLTERSAEGQIDQARPDELRFGTSVPYARFHETGQGVPKRELIKLRPAEHDQITEVLGDYIAKGER